MKKFFVALLKALGYFLLYYGVQIVVGFLWGMVASIGLGMKYAAMGLDLVNPDSVLLEQYIAESERLALEITVPATIVSNLVAVAVICLIFVCRKKKLAAELSLRKFSSKAVIPLFMAGVGCNVLTTVVLGMLPEDILAAYQQASAERFGDMDFWTVLLTVAVAPVVEEVIMRGLVYTRLKKGMPVIAAMLLSSVLFGVLHGQWVWMIYATVFGILLVRIFERTGSLYACILFHFSYNGCSVLLSLIPETTPDWVFYVLVGAAVVFTVAGLILFAKVPKAVVPAEETAVAEKADVSGMAETAECPEADTETL